MYALILNLEENSMNTDFDGKVETLPGLPYEKLFPIIPLIGSLIAVCFDVGYFYGVSIDYFTLFSLTEHIGFALEALPAALAISIILIPVLVIIERSFSWFNSRVKRVSEDSSRPLIERLSFLKPKSLQASILIFLMLLAIAIYLLCLWYQDGIRLFLWSSVVAGMIAAKGIASERWRGLDPVLFLIVGCSAALLLGEYLGSRYVAKPVTVDSIVLKSRDLIAVSDSISVNVIRSGERGVLYAKPEPPVVEFIKWDDIKSISRHNQGSFFIRK
jgi:hypothetical protein